MLPTQKYNMSPTQKKNSIRSSLTYGLSIGSAVSTQIFGFPPEEGFFLGLGIILSLLSIIMFVLFIIVRRKVDIPKKLVVVDIVLLAIVILSSVLYSIFCVKFDNFKFIHNYFIIAVINIILMFGSIIFSGSVTKKYIVNANDKEDTCTGPTEKK